MGRKKTKLKYLSDQDIRGLGGVGWKVEGVEDLERALRDLGVEVRKVLIRAAEAGAEVIRKEAEKRAPGPGVAKKVTKRGKYEAHVDVGPDKEHWYYQFFETGADPHLIPRKKKRGRTILVFEGRKGTVFTEVVRHPGMKPRPFLRPAIDEARDEAVQEAGRVFRDAISDVVRKHGE